MGFQIGHAVTHMSTTARNERAASKKDRDFKALKHFHMVMAGEKRERKKWALRILNERLPDYEDVPLGAR